MTSQRTARRVLLIGANSAIAEALARRLVARGDRLFLVARNAERLNANAADLRVRGAGGCVTGTLVADLDRLDEHAALIEQAWLATAGIDLVVIAHGQLPDQVQCERDVGALLANLQTNALSVLSLCTLVANRMETQGSGAIAVITSVAGDRGRRSNYAYGSAKGLVSRFLQGLRNRLARQGIAVTELRPGFVITPMTDGMDRSGPLWSSADQVAQGIVRAVDRRKDIAYLPGYWRWIMLVIRLIPERVFKRLSL